MHTYRPVNPNSNSGVMDEKVSATTVLGQYAEACPTAFMPFMEKALSTLSDMSQYWHDEARAAAYHSLHQLVLATHKSFPPSSAAAAAGSNPSITEPQELSAQVTHVLGVALPLLTSPVDHDTSKVAVAAAAAALAQVLKQLGRGAVGGQHLEATSNMARALLQGRAICQVSTCYETALANMGYRVSDGQGWQLPGTFVAGFSWAVGFCSRVPCWQVGRTGRCRTPMFGVAQLCTAVLPPPPSAGVRRTRRSTAWHTMLAKVS